MNEDSLSHEGFLSIERKLYRAKEHFDELSDEVKSLYKSAPGKVEVTPTPDGGALVRFVENKPTPARFGLIFGDFVQCLRSALDYLVWELARASGTAGTYRHEYPITTSEGAFAKAIGHGALNAVPVQAIALIKANQPFTRESPRTHFLWILNNLANINKHRHVLLTPFAASIGDWPTDFPHLRTKVKQLAADGTEVGEFEVWSCLRLKEENMPLVEILTAANALFEDVHLLIKQFESFFFERGGCPTSRL